jgi:4-amino-4-deoxy-L-arabinose transferase-like glycosyltransferase
VFPAAARLPRAFGSFGAVLSWTVIIWTVVFWRLGYASLLDPDEAHYAQLTREMMRTRSWFVPLLDGAPFIDKPILYHWLQAAFTTFLGESELAMRMPSAVAAVAMFWTTWWVATQLFSSRVGHASAVMFSTLPLTFALASVGVFDMVYTAFLFGAVACLLVAGLREREYLQYVGYVLLSLAVMTKGPVALLLVCLLAAGAMCAGRDARQALGRLNWGVGLLLVLVTALPWFFWMWGRFGDRFVRDYLLAGNLWYFLEPKIYSRHSTSPTFYLRIFVAAFFPWSLVTIGRAADTLAAWRASRNAPSSVVPLEERLLWTWAIVVIAFFSAARFKLDYYIFPAAPACCILAARGWTHAADHHSGAWVRRSVAAIAATFFCLGTVLSLALFRINLELSTTALAMPIALAAGGMVLFLQIRHLDRWPPSSLTVPLVTLLAVYATVVFVGLPVLERSRPTAALGRWIMRHTQPGQVVGIYGIDDWRASIRYYTDRRVRRLENRVELDEFLTTSQGGYVLMLMKDAIALRAAGEDVTVVAGRRAIVGRSGKYLRQQIWGRLVVVTRTDNARQLARGDIDVQ